jgi:branched-chain amino acid transport system substrate-binding protein
VPDSAAESAESAAVDQTPEEVAVTIPPIVTPEIDSEAAPLAHRIGLLLPLTGRRAELGQRAAAAVRLALGSPPAGDVQLVVKDTGGDEFQAARAALELIREEGVAAIVGPLLSSASPAAAAVAEALDVPLIAPVATDQRLAGMGANVFQANGSMAEQGRTMAAVARHDFLCRRVAVIHGNTEYGKAVAGAFQERFEALGGTIVGEERYGGSSPEFDAMTRRIRELRPDGIFMPIPGRHVVRLAPLLLYHDLHAALLGASGWADDAVMALGDQYVGGAAFAVPFNAYGEDPPTRFFVRNYREANGSTPDLVAAFAYDCTRLLILAMRREPRTSAELRALIAGDLGFRGTCGALRFGADGHALTPPRVVTLHQGRTALIGTDAGVTLDEESTVGGEPSVKGDRAAADTSAMMVREVAVHG